MSTHTIHGITLALMRGNIVDVQVEAIVNAANSAFAGGGGVDGAIHRAGGPSIMEACRGIGGCPTGSAVATTAGGLKAKYIFHAVGPIYRWHGDEARLLADAYQSCLDLAERHQITSIAFPSISTGAYSYPISEAAPIALKTVLAHLEKPTSLQQVLFVLFDERTYAGYEQALARLLPA